MASLGKPVPLQATGVGVALDHDGPLEGVILMGPSGIGKTSTALALIEGCPFQRSALIGDDMVLLSTDSGEILASPAQAMAGFAEIRGFGLTKARMSADTRLRLMVKLTDSVPTRVSSPTQAGLGETGLSLPSITLKGHNIAATDLAIRIRSILRTFLTGQSH